MAGPSPSLAALRSGRHDLAPEDVAAHQRGRIEHALASCVVEAGLAATTLSMIVRRAHVSRQTFYELYTDKRECYDALIAGFVQRLWDEGADYSAATTWGEFETALRRGFEALAAEPDVAHCLYLEPPGGNPQLTRQHTIGRGRLVETLGRLLPDGDPFGAQALAALIRQVIEDHLADGRADELPARAHDVVVFAQAYERGARPPA